MAEKQRVCVTGAGGYIASWLVKFLLSRGYFVRGTVRDPCDEKNAHLKKLDNAAENLILFKADLFDCQSLCSAIAGCTGVFHVACPVPNVVEAPVAGTEVVETAVTGTRNVLEACIKVRVKKVVVVSSIGAVMFIPNWPKDRVMDEECWSEIEFLRSLKGPMANYLLGKTMAEKEVLEYEKRSDLEIVTVCPSITIGPRLQPSINTSSLFLLKLLRDGIESMEDTNVNLVDVRDVADALLLVYENQETKGRYICNSHSLRMRALTEKLNSMYPNHNLPKRITEKKENEYEEHGLLSLEKLRKLGWQYKPLEETIADSVTNFEEIGDLPKTVTAY